MNTNAAWPHLYPHSRDAAEDSMATIEQLAQKIAAMKAEHVKDIEQAIRDEYAVELPDTAEQPYTPPCDAPDGFEWAGEFRALKAGDWYQHPQTEEVGPYAMHTDGDCLDYMTRHILRKLPAPPKPEDQVPPATTTAEGGAREWKPGDRAWVEVEVVNGEPDCDGEVEVQLPRVLSRQHNTAFTLPSALRETPGGGE